MTNIKTLSVDLGPLQGGRSYPIYIGSGLLGHAELLGRHIAGKQVVVVTNDIVAPLYLEKILGTVRSLAHIQRCETVILPDGEQYKTLEVLNRIFDVLLDKHFDRGVTLVALGGGVIGDMTGFAAACYQRGVDFIQVPTTLLAQVDSSVGGKTGVNHPLGKNMIGAFHQPRCVIADIDTLNTLPDRELSAGIAEVIKYGLIGDAEFFDWLEASMDKLLARDAASLMVAVERSCADKTQVVIADEREGGARALLNLGHTFGHAIETGMGYGSWLHGEAVATGMCMAVRMSARRGWLSHADVVRTEALIQRANLPVRAPAALDAARFIELMGVDKKVKNGKIRLVLLKAIGEAIITDDFAPELLTEVMDECRETC